MCAPIHARGMCVWRGWGGHAPSSTLWANWAASCRWVAASSDWDSPNLNRRVTASVLAWVSCPRTAASSLSLMANLSEAVARCEDSSLRDRVSADTSADRVEI